MTARVPRAAMCALPPAWLCLVLLPLGIQSLAVTHRHRPSKNPKSSPTAVLLTASDPSVAAGDSIAQGDRPIPWRALLHKEPPSGLSDPSLDRADGVSGEAPVWQRGSRDRRHANGGRGHGHLMRVGCVLGTCQVQNLSHRLYQLIGQSGRENSSPMNPRSPHSYG